MDEDENSIIYTQMAVLEQLRYAVKVRRVNDELLEHLASTLWWLLHYAAKNNIDLPDKDKISLALDRAMEIARKQPRSRATTHFSTPKRDTPEDDRTINIISALTIQSVKYSYLVLLLDSQDFFCGI
jgi:NTP pyrophosphatase (non-canonical NTP hydrolase)